MPGREDWAVHVALWQAGTGIAAAAVSLPARGEVYAIRPTGPGGRGRSTARPPSHRGQ